jgi:hypothetical protein
MSNYKVHISLAVLLIVIGAFTVVWQVPWFAGASVPAGGNAYQAASTKNYDGAALTNLTVLKTGQGELARVTVTGANTGIIRFWDATTTSLSLRASSKASSTIHIADLPASLAAGTYDFDVEFTDGLIYELVGGAAPTSTISWR